MTAQTTPSPSRTAEKGTPEHRTLTRATSATDPNDPTDPKDLGWDLGNVSRAHLSAAGAVVAQLPGGLRGFGVLDAAASADLPSSQQALAQQLRVDRTVMTYLLDDLEKDGLVRRRRDPADRRAHRVETTEKGLALLADLRGALAAVDGELLAPLDPPEQAQFRLLLGRLSDAAQSKGRTPACGEDPGGAPCPSGDAPGGTTAPTTGSAAPRPAPARPRVLRTAAG